RCSCTPWSVCFPISIRPDRRLQTAFSHRSHRRSRRSPAWLHSRNHVSLVRHQSWCARRLPHHGGPATILPTDHKTSFVVFCSRRRHNFWHARYRTRTTIFSWRATSAECLRHPRTFREPVLPPAVWVSARVFHFAAVPRQENIRHCQL